MVSRVTEVVEGVHRLTNGVANFYLIEQADKLVLVDAGAPKDWVTPPHPASPRRYYG